MRGRSYSYSPSPPPRGYGRRRRSPSLRGRYIGRSRDLPTSLLVRNLRLDCRPEDLRAPFGRFGPLKDIYLPRDYHTGGGRAYDRRRSPLRYSRSPCYGRSYSRSPEYYSPSPRHMHYSRSLSPRRRRYSEGSYSRSPYSASRYRERSYCRSPYGASRSRYRERSYSMSPYGASRSPVTGRSKSRSRSLEY